MRARAAGGLAATAPCPNEPDREDSEPGQRLAAGPGDRDAGGSRWWAGLAGAALLVIWRQARHLSASDRRLIWTELLDDRRRQGHRRRRRGGG